MHISAIILVAGHATTSTEEMDIPLVYLAIPSEKGGVAVELVTRIHTVNREYALIPSKLDVSAIGLPRLDVTHMGKDRASILVVGDNFDPQNLVFYGRVYDHPDHPAGEFIKTALITSFTLEKGSTVSAFSAPLDKNFLGHFVDVVVEQLFGKDKHQYEVRFDHPDDDGKFKL